MYSSSGLTEMECSQIAKSTVSCIRRQKSDSENVHLALQSRFPEESFIQNNPDPGLD